jgi:hypothetical protein
MSNRVKSEIISLSGFERATRIDLGLEIARWHARPGEPMTREILAELCGCLLSIEGRGQILRDSAQPKTQ